MVLSAGCDVDYHFIVTCCNHSGSTNDIIAWQNMELYQILEVEKKLPLKYYFIGNEAFTNTLQFLSPWHGIVFDNISLFFFYIFSSSFFFLFRSRFR
jgi:hypothetical protein